MRERYSTVVTPKHVAIQALICYWIQKQKKKSQKVRFISEYPYDHKGKTYIADVYVEWITGRKRTEHIYEVQKDFDAKTFNDKMKDLDKLGIIIPEDNVPDDINDLSNFIKDSVMLL